MKRDTLVCDEHISSETLSSWRDGFSQGRDAEWLRQHIATCRACQETLASFHEVTLALRRQHELDPGDRIVQTVQERASAPTRRRSSRSHRRWGGLAALASVAAVLLLFTGLFGYLSHIRDTGTLPTSKATPTATRPPIPTFDSNKEQFSPVVQAQDVWGTGAITAQFNNAIDATHYYMINSVTPDGSKLVGAEVGRDANGSYTTPTAGIIDVANKHFTSIPVPVSQSWGTSALTTDGRFIITSTSLEDPEPVTNVYDLSTGQVHPINARYAQLSSGYILYWSDKDQRLHLMDLVSGTDEKLDIIGAVAFTWPYMLYTTPNTLTGPYTLRIRDLSTGQDVALPQLNPLAKRYVDSNPNYAPTFALAGDTVFGNLISGRVSTSNVPPNNVTDSTAMSTLYELDHVFSENSQLRIVGRYHGVVGGLVGANDRLVIYNFAVWDRAEWRFVKFSTLKDGDGPMAQLSGNTLMLEQTQTTNTGTVNQDVTLYDTTHLPVRGP